MTPFPYPPHAARTTTRLYKDGTYVYECIAIDAAGDYAIRDLTLTVSQAATTMIVSPIRATVVRGHTAQFTGTLLDQFGHDLRGSYTVLWSIVSGKGTVDSAGIFKSVRKAGTTVLQTKSKGVHGTAKITVV